MNTTAIKTAAAAVLALALVAMPAAATTITPTGTIRGRVESTWLANGGAAKLGDPIAYEQKARISSRNVYDQRTTGGYRVFWSSYAGGKVWRDGVVPPLSGVSNERDALAGSGFRGGLVWRTGALHKSSTTADQLLTAQLNPGGYIIDLRTSGAASARPDPSLPGVTRVRYGISHTFADDYRKYVTDSGARTSLARALKTLAATDSPVVVHCAEGKDRTGVVITILLAILGADPAAIQTEYLRSPDVRADDLTDFLDQVATSYGAKDNTAPLAPDQQWVGDVTGSGMYWFVRDGLGLSNDTIAALRAKYAR